MRESVTLSWEETIVDDADAPAGDVPTGFGAAPDAGSERSRLARPDAILSGGLASGEPGGPDARPALLARFGPFHVVSPDVIELHGVIDAASPAAFRRAMAAFPQLRTLRLIDCPGTEDDEANFQIARMVRRAGLETHVPAGGSVRSGGVDLFLAGVTRRADPGAEFGVHSWQDNDGLQARDAPADDPVHQRYISFYVAMGMTPQQARAFYDFTNAAAAADDVHYMTADELRRYGLIG